MTILKPKSTARRRKTAAMAGLVVLTIICASVPSFTFAAEGASSHYLPGAVGDIFLAVPPEPGLQVADLLYYQTGSTGQAVLEGITGFIVESKFDRPAPVFFQDPVQPVQDITHR